MRSGILSAFVAFAIDQASKYAVLHGFAWTQQQEVAIFPPFLIFRAGWNRGINFGLLAHGTEMMRWFLIFSAIAISLWIFLWQRRIEVGLWGQIASGLLIGGAMGNVADRLYHGAVFDFLNMSCCGINNPYIFNLADVAIFMGAVGIAFFPGSKSTSDKKRREN